MDYATIYCKKFMDTSDGHSSLRNKILKFGDALSAVAYAHGISYKKLIDTFPIVGRNNKWEGPDYSLEQQIAFINNNKIRNPKNVLEIGGGRGEVSHFLAHLGYNVTCVEPGVDAKEVFNNTGEQLFPGNKHNINLHNCSLHELKLDYSEYDTILMVESLEHILAEHFDPQWETIKSQFKGYFVVTNWLAYHPIAVGQYASPSIHCRLVNDALYDYFSLTGKVHTRDRSHLSLEI